VTRFGSPHPGSRWFGPVIAALLPLLDLPHNWNTHGRAVEQASLSGALGALMNLLHPDTRPANVRGAMRRQLRMVDISLLSSCLDRDSGVLSINERRMGRPPDTPCFVEDALSISLVMLDVARLLAGWSPRRTLFVGSANTSTSRAPRQDATREDALR